MGNVTNVFGKPRYTCLTAKYLAMEALQEDQEGGGDGLLAPPTEYRRMLSWQLSQLQPAPVTSTRRAQKERERRRKRSSNAEVDDIQSSGDIAGEEEEEDAEERGEDGGFAYLVVNSDGEEECYYSAPESPPVSEDDGKNISISYLAGVVKLTDLEG